MPWPYGGKTRIVSVDLDLAALKAKNLAPMDVVNALNAQNLILPSGTTKIGGTEYAVELNTTPKVMDELGDLPIKTVNGAVICIRDVAQVRDGYQPQQNIVRNEGVRGALLTVYKTGAASTLDVVSGIKKALPRVLSGLTPDLNVKEFADQSIFVRVGHLRRRPGRRHRRGADGVDDSAVPRFVAQHVHHRAVHPAVGADLHRHSQRAGRDDQPDDPGRAGAGGRHSRGRRDGGHREHPPAHGVGQSAGRRHPGRRAGDRDAGVRLDAVHLHRVRADVLPDRAWRTTCLCRWPRRWCSRCWPATCCRGRWCRRW